MRFALLLFGFFALVWANTESILISIPADFPNKPVYVGNSEQISLVDNVVTERRDIIVPAPASNISSTQYYELVDFNPNSVYNLRISWTALHPIDVYDTKQTIVPHNSPYAHFEAVPHARLFVEFNTKFDCYSNDEKLMKLDQSVPINISLVKVKFGIPLDLFPHIILLVLVGTTSGLLFYRYGYEFLSI